MMRGSSSTTSTVDSAMAVAPWWVRPGCAGDAATERHWDSFLLSARPPRVFGLNVPDTFGKWNLCNGSCCRCVETPNGLVARMWWSRYLEAVNLVQMA